MTSRTILVCGSMLADIADMGMTLGWPAQTASAKRKLKQKGACGYPHIVVNMMTPGVRHRHAACDKRLQACSGCSADLRVLASVASVRDKICHGYFHPSTAQGDMDLKASSCEKMLCSGKSCFCHAGPCKTDNTFGQFGQLCYPSNEARSTNRNLKVLIIYPHSSHHVETRSLALVDVLGLCPFLPERRQLQVDTLLHVSTAHARNGTLKHPKAEFCEQYGRDLYKP